MKNVSELRELNDTDLKLEYESLQKDLFKLRIRYQTDQDNGIHKFKQLKRQIARVKTFITQRLHDNG